MQGAVSAEAKASAAVLGVVAAVVMFLVYVTTPDYIMPLFWTTRTGNFLLACSGLLDDHRRAGDAKMINFKF